jgi:hypothetical protein
MTNRNEQEETEPAPPPEPIEALTEQARRLERVTGEHWLAEELRYMWENPEEFAAGEFANPPEHVTDEVYAVLYLGIAFGIEYEQAYPGDGWDDED